MINLRSILNRRLGVMLPFVTIDAMPASAPAKVAIALDRFGLSF